MREYYGKLRELLEKGAVKRITDLKTGEEGIYKNEELILSTAGYSMPELYTEEVIALRPTLVLFGFGHIGKNIYKIASLLDFPLVIFDDRKDIIKDGDYSNAEIIIDDFDNIFKKRYAFENPYFLIFTHGHKADEEALYYVLKNYNSRYVGMIGSKKKIALTYSNLEKRGIGRALLEKVHAPIGIEIMAQSPAEIAVSILAEIIKTYREDKKQLAIDYSMLEYLEKEEEKLILVRIIEKEGSGPREKGAEMAVTERDSFSTVGGGAIEMECIKEARKMLRCGEKFKVKDFVLETESPLAMACGGNAKVLFKLLE